MSRRLLTSLLVLTGLLPVLGVMRAAATPTSARHADITVSDLAQLAQGGQDRTCIWAGPRAEYRKRHEL